MVFPRGVIDGSDGRYDEGSMFRADGGSPSWTRSSMREACGGSVTARSAFSRFGLPVQNDSGSPVRFLIQKGHERVMRRSRFSPARSRTTKLLIATWSERVGACSSEQSSSECSSSCPLPDGALGSFWMRARLLQWNPGSFAQRKTESLGWNECTSQVAPGSIAAGYSSSPPACLIFMRTGIASSLQMVHTGVILIVMWNPSGELTTIHARNRAAPPPPPSSESAES
mmetsp:Transcript_15625/g.37738  ORF Transcript_15625/g.37738 Transcript_15625/m.37738 type:complete len:227 (-) Transcript_15625:1588-2268(-)